MFGRERAAHKEPLHSDVQRANESRWPWMWYGWTRTGLVAAVHRIRVNIPGRKGENQNDTHSMQTLPPHNWIQRHAHTSHIHHIHHIRLYVCCNFHGSSTVAFPNGMPVSWNYSFCVQKHRHFISNQKIWLFTGNRLCFVFYLFWLYERNHRRLVGG